MPVKRESRPSDRPDTLGTMQLHVGCAMWNHAPWQGRYLPSPLGPRERLRAYATWCGPATCPSTEVLIMRTAFRLQALPN